MENIVWNYWDTGYENMPNLIKKLYEHNKQTCEKYNYELRLVTKENVKQFIPNVPAVFFDVASNFQSDYVRYNVLYLHGGIWLDSDALIYENPNKLKEKIIDNRKDMFITKVIISHYHECAVIAVRQKLLPILCFCVNYVNFTLKTKGTEMEWNDIGPETAKRVVNKYNELILVLNDSPNNYNPINFLTWANCRAIENWCKTDQNEAKNIADSIFIQNYPVILTWQIYKIQDETAQNKVLNDSNSIFYNLIHRIV
jgi:hypothetical protein